MLLACVSTTNEDSTIYDEPTLDGAFAFPNIVTIYRGFVWYSMRRIGRDAREGEQFLKPSELRPAAPIIHSRR